MFTNPALSELGLIPKISEISPRMRWVFLVFCLSLLVRTAFLLPVVHGQTRIKFDENGYFNKASAQHSILKSLLGFRSPEKKDIDVAYGVGTWPPFHPLVLALGFFIFGKSIIAARITIVLISALTTSLIFLTGEKLFGRKTGAVASSIHILHPSFIAFSHFLWSETTFIFLLFLGVYLVLRITEVESQKKNIVYALELGTILGFLALTRAAALPFLFVILGFVFLRKKSWKHRIVTLLIAVVVFTVVVAPWEIYLYKKSGSFVIFSNFSYRNFYMGNNPWIRDGLWFRTKTDYEQEKLMQEKRKVLSRYAREHSVSVEEAARALALKEITSHFGEFAVRMVVRGLHLWTFDFFPLRHAVHVVYPPVPGIFIIFILLIFILWHTALILLSVFGFLIRSPRSGMKSFVLVLVAAGMLPYIVTFTNTRFNLPQVALLIPVAAFGATKLKTVKRDWRFSIMGMTTVLCLFCLFYCTYSSYVLHVIRPSSYYYGSMRILDKVFHSQGGFADVLIFKSSSPSDEKRIVLSILNPERYSFLQDRKMKRLQFKLRGFHRVVIYSSDPREPLKLSLRSGAQAISLEPISKEFWGDYRKVPLDNVVLTWGGGY